MINIHNPRNRAALFGGVGGFLGWILSQTLWGTPDTFAGAVAVGAMAGLGIGTVLGVSEGLTAASGMWVAIDMPRRHPDAMPAVRGQEA